MPPKEKDQPKAPTGEDTILVGGPGQPAPKPDDAAAPKLVGLKIAGREFQLPEDVAQAYQEREKEYARGIEQKGVEIGRLRQELDQSRRPADAPKSPAGPDLNTLWFEDPQKAAELIEAKITRTLTGQYQQAEALKGFWQDFYRKHADLSDDDFLVRAVYTERFADLADLTVRDAEDKLADLTRQEILRLTKKRGGSTNDSASRPIGEEASGERAPRREGAEDEEKGPKSLSDVIRARAKARRDAASKRPAVAGG